MFAAMANTISAVYRGDRSDAQAFAEEATAYVARGWEYLAATGAAAVTALATGIAAGTITVASVSTAVVSGAAAAAAAVPVAGAIVLAAILIGKVIYDVLAGSTGEPPDLVEFPKTDTVRLRPREVDAYAAGLALAMRSWRPSSPGRTAKAASGERWSAIRAGRPCGPRRIGATSSRNPRTPRTPGATSRRPGSPTATSTSWRRTGCGRRSSSGSRPSTRTRRSSPTRP